MTKMYGLDIDFLSSTCLCRIPNNPLHFFEFALVMESLLMSQISEDAIIKFAAGNCYQHTPMNILRENSWFFWNVQSCCGSSWVRPRQLSSSVIRFYNNHLVWTFLWFLKRELDVQSPELIWQTVPDWRRAQVWWNEKIKKCPKELSHWNQFLDIL